MDWLDLLAVQGTFKSLLQHHSWRASILWHSAFFIVQLSHPYMTTGKTIALTSQTFVDKVMSLLFNMLSRLVITYLPRSKHLLISWLQSPSTVILEPRKIKSATVSTVPPSICHEVMGSRYASVYMLSGVCFLSHLIQRAESNRDIIWMPAWGLLKTKPSPRACYSNREIAVTQIDTRWKKLWAHENSTNIFHREFTYKLSKDTFQKMLRRPSKSLAMLICEGLPLYEARRKKSG